MSNQNKRLRGGITPPRPHVGVAGFGRCGSTMMMGMLDAGGYPPAGNVAAESYELLDGADLNKMARMAPAGKAVKYLDYHLHNDAPMWTRNVMIVLWRNPADQTASFVKWMSGIVTPDVLATSGARDRFTKSLATDRPRLQASTRRAAPFVVEFQFEDILADPHRHAENLALVLPAFDADAAAAVVRRERTE